MKVKWRRREVHQKEKLGEERDLLSHYPVVVSFLLRVVRKGLATEPEKEEGAAPC